MSSMDTSGIAADEWSPSVVVGIDFGMTSTGVAHASRDTGWADPRVIQEWPDRGGRLVNKYPSRVAYDMKGRLVDWGQCDVTQEDVREEREFKLSLDPAYKDPNENSVSHGLAAQWYTDYMTKLYDYLQTYFEGQYPQWEQRQVEYRFSVPTTWISPAQAEKVRRWLNQAGFGGPMAMNRRVMVSQTEAEAAAVYAARNYKQGDIILVVDAGGATTDLNILEITRKSDKDNFAQMKALDKAEGLNIGSVMIDAAARALIVRKLERMNVHATDALEYLAEDMMDQSGFERYKCRFDANDVPIQHNLRIPQDDNTAGPPREVILEWREMGDCFEPLVADLIKSIGEKIDKLRRFRPQSQLRYIVLSGGLGSSKYVRRRLNDQFRRITRPGNAPNLEILTARDPQLAIAKGLVMDRSQFLNVGETIYTRKCSRVSYGTLVTQIYDKSIHVGETPVRHSTTGQTVVQNQFDWFIKEGEEVPEAGILRKYQPVLPKNNEAANIEAHIYMCELPSQDLPLSYHRRPVNKLCVVRGRVTAADYRSEDFNLVKDKSSSGYIKAKLNLKVLVGSTDLRFEIVSDSGRSFSKNTETIQVEWCEYPPPAR